MRPSAFCNESKAQRLAHEIIDSYGLREPDEIDLEAIALDQGVDVRYAPLVGCEARLVRLGDRGIVTVDHSHGLTGRTRFSVAHELGHWNMHQHINQFWRCSNANIFRYDGAPEELEANAFAAELIMPTAMIRPQVREGSLGFGLVDTLSAKFRASLTATALRCVSELNEPAAVVLSDQNRIIWSWRNSHVQSWQFAIKKGACLGEQTKAWCTAESQGHEEMTVVPTDAWFPDHPTHWKVETWEASRFLQGFGTVLSLLTVNEY
ncbi:MAG: ImmA/IrrE family metallo-endopeptidase [Fimbriimonadales bacterium]